jgi:hypothetical protein
MAMTMGGVAHGEDRRVSLGPWLWSRPLDLALFGGSAALALMLAALASVTGLNRQPFPAWGFVLFVLAIDVAHVYATLFRTYLDGAELGRHPWRYVLVPLLTYTAAVILYSDSALTFWRVFAYVALFHFVRQQVGWVAVYRARAGARGRWDRVIDEACVYSSTLYPVLYWHATLETRQFVWFVEGDFVNAVQLSQALLPWARAVWVVSLLVFFVRHVARANTRTTK